MAERRMFAKSVALDDAYIDLSFREKTVYFYLALLADDDGFVSGPRGVIRQIGAEETDLDVLEKKGFIYRFDTGAVVVRHWKVNNYIAKDRYKKTKHSREKNMLFVDEDGVYTKCIQDVHNLDTQDRLGKDRLGKDRSGEGNDAPAAAPPSFEKEMLLIQEQYNRICTALPRCMRLSEARKKSLAKALAAGRTVEDFVAVFGKAQASAFLKGGNARGWAADFDWLIREQNMDKVLEGSYDDRSAVPKGASGTLGQAELEAIQRVLQEKE